METAAVAMRNGGVNVDGNSGKDPVGIGNSNCYLDLIFGDG
jgi:hypothetical protein